MATVHCAVPLKEKLGNPPKNRFKLKSFVNNNITKTSHCNMRNNMKVKTNQAFSSKFPISFKQTEIYNVFKQTEI